MIKNILVCLSLASLFTAGVALAEDKVQVEPGKGPTEAMSKATPTMTPPSTKPDAGTTGAAPASCTQEELTVLITKAGALADKDKQKMTLGHLDLAKKSMDLKDMAGCAMHMKEATANLGVVKK